MREDPRLLGICTQVCFRNGHELIWNDLLIEWTPGRFAVFEEPCAFVSVPSRWLSPAQCLKDVRQACFATEADLQLKCCYSSPACEEAYLAYVAALALELGDEEDD